MVNTKKLVVNFLILAGIVGGMIWFFSGLKSSNKLALGTQNLKIAAVDGSALDRNYSGVAGGANLTNLMAENLFERAVLDAAGEPSSSTANSIIDQLKPEEIQSLLKENISALTPIEEADLKITKSDTAKDRLNYIRAVNEILRVTVGNSQLNELAAQSLSPELIESIRLIFDQAVEGLVKVPTPKSLLPAHKKLLTFLNQYQRILASVINYKSDPLKTIVLLDMVDTLSQSNLQNFQEALKKIPPPEETVPTSFKSPSFIERLLGVKIALAQLNDYVPVDCSGEACSGLFASEVEATNAVTKAIYELLNAKVFHESEIRAREKLKSNMIKLIERQAMDYVQGSSTPKYVQNWQGETQNEADKASGAVIKKETAELCPSFRSITKIALGDRGVIMNGSGKNCSLQGVVTDTTAFYNDFDKGGWDGYFEALKPENNLFGSIITLNDKASRAGAEAAEAARSESESGQGFRSSKTCRSSQTYTLADLKEKGVMEEGATIINPGEEGYYANALGEDYIEGTPTAGGTKLTTCQRNGWEITTPGNVVGQTLNNSLALSSKRIGEIQDFDSSSTLNEILASSSQNRLIRAEERGPDSQGILDVYRGPEPHALENPYSVCLRMSGKAKQDCLSTVLDTEKVRQLIDNPARIKDLAERYARDYINNQIDKIKNKVDAEINKIINDFKTKVCNALPIWSRPFCRSIF